MTLNKTMTVTCDARQEPCDSQVSRDDEEATPAKVRKEAKRLGWLVNTAPGFDFCPAHREEAG